MATVNKASLRTEFDALKARFESLCAAGKMSAQSRALVDALLMLFELLMAVFMEKHTPKSAANSSLPASQSPDDATARSRPGAKGKGPASNEARAANTRTRTYIAELCVDSCARCGEDLTDTACTGHERRTLIDIVFEKVVRHADAEIKHCPRCRTETRARFPAEMPGPLQYGPGIKAYAVHLLVAQMLSLKRVAQSMHALIGQLLSEATLLGYIAQLHRALAEWVGLVLELRALRPRPVWRAPVARAHLHRRRPRLRLGQANETPPPPRLPRSRQTRREDAHRKRIQGRTETLPHHLHPGRARASTDSTASKGSAWQSGQVRCTQPVGAHEKARDRRAALRQAPRRRVYQQSGLFRIRNKPDYPRSRIIPESSPDPPIRAPSSARCRNNHKLFRNARTLSCGSYLLIGVPAGVVLAIARSFSSRSACR